MDRIEFYESFTNEELPESGKPGVKYMVGIQSDIVWKWVEQYGIEQRIDENEKFKNAVIDEAVMIDDEGNDVKPEGEYEGGMDNVGSGLLRRIKKRIKELKDE